MAIVLTPDKRVFASLVSEMENLSGEAPEIARVPPCDQRGIRAEPDMLASLLAASSALANAMPAHHKKKVHLVPVLTCAESASEYFDLRLLRDGGQLPGRILGREDILAAGATGGATSSIYGRMRWLKRKRRCYKPAQRGAALLDTREPRWWDYVDALEIREPGGVLRQLYGEEAALEAALVLAGDTDSLQKLGFGAEPEDRLALSLRWASEVRLREEASPGTASPTQQDIETEASSNRDGDSASSIDSTPTPDSARPGTRKRRRKKPEVRPAKRSEEERADTGNTGSEREEAADE